MNLHRQGGLFTLRVERPSGRKVQEVQMVAPVAMDDAENEPSDELPEWLQAFNPDDYLEEENEREGLADAEEFHAPAGPDARAVTTPATPTEAERRAHAIAHLPYRGWCEHCVSEKGVEEPHFRQDAGASWSVWFRLTTASTGRQLLSVLRKRLCARCLSQSTLTLAWLIRSCVGRRDARIST